MNFIQDMSRFLSRLTQETGERNPVVKIEVKAKVWNWLIIEYHEKLNMTVEGASKICSIQFLGVEIVKGIK